jgi:NAD(P)-dependent dehydrogenase (short-subunit alcohol dehydrogenase family)
MTTAVVTGANGGIGYHTALHLARSGAKLILGCRDQVRGADAVLRIMKEVPNSVVELSILDLSSLESVEKFANRLQANNASLDLLVNNAAVMALPQRTLSKDGYEMQFATNHLGHFALTARLMPLLLASPAARVVTVSSIAHRYGKIDFNNLQGEQNYEGWNAYGTSKLANLLFAFELARRAKASGKNLLSLAAHPGVAKTNILASGPQRGPKVLRTYISEIFTQFFAQTDAEGALPVVHACQSPDVQNGDYFGPDGFAEVSGKPTKVQAKPHALEEDTAKKLWDISEQLTHTKCEI